MWIARKEHKSRNLWCFQGISNGFDGPDHTASYDRHAWFDDTINNIDCEAILIDGVKHFAQMWYWKWSWSLVTRSGTTFFLLIFLEHIIFRRLSCFNMFNFDPLKSPRLNPLSGIIRQWTNQARKRLVSPMIRDKHEAIFIPPQSH